MLINTSGKPAAQSLGRWRQLPGSSNMISAPVPSHHQFKSSGPRPDQTSLYPHPGPNAGWLAGTLQCMKPSLGAVALQLAGSRIRWEDCENTECWAHPLLIQKIWGQNAILCIFPGDADGSGTPLWKPLRWSRAVFLSLAAITVFIGGTVKATAAWVPPQKLWLRSWSSLRLGI